MPSGGCGSEVTIVVRKPCAHCQRLWSAQTLVTVGAAELCPVCYKQRRWAGKPSKGDRAAAEVTLEGKLRSIRHRGTGKVAQR